MIYDCSYCMARILGVFGSGKGGRESIAAFKRGANPVELMLDVVARVPIRHDCSSWCWFEETLS
jgi:hypothetical protein